MVGGSFVNIGGIEKMKNKYKVFFELFGKKMQVEKEASSETEAKAQVAESIKFFKVEKLDWKDETLANMHNVVTGIKSFRKLCEIAKENGANLDFDADKDYMAELVKYENKIESIVTMIEKFYISLDEITNLGNEVDDESFEDKLKRIAKDRGIDLN